MKKIVVVILCVTMLLTCLTACKQEPKPTAPETKTEVSAPAVVDQQPKEEVQETIDQELQQSEEDKEESQQQEEQVPETSQPETVDQPQQEEPVEQEIAEPEEEPVSKVKSKPVSKAESKPASKVESKPASKVESKPVSKVESKPAGSQVNEFVDLVDDLPTFKSVYNLRQWLKEDRGLYKEERENLVNTMSNNNRITYYMPKMVNDKNCELVDIKIENYGDWNYNFRIGGFDFSIYVNQLCSKGTIDDQIYYQQVEKSTWEESPIIANDISFYHMKDSLDMVHVFWHQFDCVHSALIGGEPKELEKFLPLLELEQVTVKLNDDAVVQ